jgi:hypothetical protein
LFTCIVIIDWPFLPRLTKSLIISWSDSSPSPEWSEHPFLTLFTSTVRFALVAQKIKQTAGLASKKNPADSILLSAGFNQFIYKTQFYNIPLFNYYTKLYFRLLKNTVLMLNMISFESILYFWKIFYSPR